MYKAENRKLKLVNRELLDKVQSMAEEIKSLQDDHSLKDALGIAVEEVTHLQEQAEKRENALGADRAEHRVLIAKWMKERLQRLEAESMISFLMGSFTCGHEAKHSGGACGACHAVGIDILQDMIHSCEGLVKFCWSPNGWRGESNMKGVLEHADHVRDCLARAQKFRDASFRADSGFKVKP